MEILRATIADAQPILDLQKLCFQSEAKLYEDYRIPPLLQTVQQLVEELHCMTVLKALEGQEIVGSVRAHADKGTCHIGRLIVHPQRQNHGIGTQLMVAIENLFGDVPRFELFTGDRSQKNLHLYNKLGYREFKRESLGGEVILVYMEKARHPSENKRLVLSMYEQGWGNGRLEAFDEAWAPTHVLHWNEQTRTDQKRTLAELKSVAGSYRAAFPDLSVHVDHLVAEGDKVAVQVTFEGTHRGVYEGFPPTHKRSRFTDMQILTLVDGKIVETTLGSGGLKYFFGVLDGSLLDQ